MTCDVRVSRKNKRVCPHRTVTYALIGCEIASCQFTADRKGYLKDMIEKYRDTDTDSVSVLVDKSQDRSRLNVTER